MPNWWVNHKQTYREETAGGFLWSPKRNSNGARNQSYDNMALVEPGDLVFSYANGTIQQIGIATDRGISTPKPAEFGQKGENWSVDGWLVPIEWQPLSAPLRPKDIIDQLAPDLPAKFSPISPEGNGRQNIYLAAIPDQMAASLLANIADGLNIVVESQQIEIGNPLLNKMDDRIEAEIRNNTDIDSTERQELVRARRGQGRFRRNLEGIEVGCRITGVTDRRLLRASHIKPWRLCASNHERLDGNNGLLLTPTFDLLFDKGYMSFADDGECLLSPKMPTEQLGLIGLDAGNLPSGKPLGQGQRAYMAFHRNMFGF